MSSDQDRPTPASNPEPQDHLPGEVTSGAAQFEMPVIRAQEVTPAPEQGRGITRIGGTPGQRSMVSVFGDVRRQGNWTIAEQTTAVPVFGDIRLDLREASFETQTVTVKAYVVFGDLKLIVPPGVQVDLRGFTIFGDHDLKQRTVAPEDAPRLVVEGYAVFGDVKVLELEIGEEEPKWYDRFRRS